MLFDDNVSEISCHTWCNERGYPAKWALIFQLENYLYGVSRQSKIPYYFQSFCQVWPQGWALGSAIYYLKVNHKQIFSKKSILFYKWYWKFIIISIFFKMPIIEVQLHLIFSYFICLEDLGTSCHSISWRPIYTVKYRVLTLQFFFNPSFRQWYLITGACPSTHGLEALGVLCTIHITSF